MTVPTDGFRRLQAAFLATRANANTRAAYGRDLDGLADALGIGPADGPLPAFGVEDDPAARAAAAA
ncbi:MAG: hypothetical protein AB1416_14285, partial [Actinomycetota bacterium]